MNYEENLKNLKEELDRLKNMKYKSEARLEQLNSQKKDILLEIEKLGIKPEDLEKEISNLKNEIDKLFNEANDLMPGLWFFGHKGIGFKFK